MASNRQQAPRNPGLRDVAALVGVSRQTISRVLNDGPYVSDDTRRRVMEGVKALGYQVNAPAKALATGKTRLIALLVPDIGNPHFARIARAASEEAEHYGYDVVLWNCGESPRRELGYLRSLPSHRVDGVVVCSSRLSAGALREFVSGEVPIALINRSLGGQSAVPEVIVDAEVGAASAARLLADLGHRTIGILSFRPPSESAAVRLRGYGRSLEGQGVKIDSRQVRRVSPDMAGGYAGATSMFARVPRLTALLCANDLIALGAVQAAYAQGLRVPEDVSIVGFDDIAAASSSTPPLTTVHIPQAELGRTAVDLLIGRLRGEPSPSSPVVLPTQLVQRGSHAPCVAADTRAVSARAVQRTTRRGNTPVRLGTILRTPAGPPNPSRPIPNPCKAPAGNPEPPTRR